MKKVFIILLLGVAVAAAMVSEDTSIVSLYGLRAAVSEEKGGIESPKDLGNVESRATGEVVFKPGYKCSKSSVILISIDTLRADHLGCYGYEKQTTANIDQFSKECVLFKNTIVQAPSTEPSHASIFTSMLPSGHGAFFTMKQKIADNVKTMAEIFKENGYATASFNGGAQLSAEFGFDRGFDKHESSKGNFMSKVNAAKPWLIKKKGQKFFLFLHTYETHHPYTPRPEYLEMFDKNYKGQLPQDISGEILTDINEGRLKITEADKQHIINAYDAEIYSMDKAFKALVDFLKKNGLYDKTIIIFTSDHGEEFGEHGMMGWHSHTLYDELLKVPLIIKFPDSAYASSTVEAQVRSIDILPTVLDVLGIAAPEGIEGVSLTKWFSSKKSIPLLSVSEQDTEGIRHPSAIRSRQWKYYDNLIHKLLFDLQADPLEQKPLKGGGNLAEQLEEILDRQATKGTSKKTEINPDTIKRLKSLGYIK
jgi:arylsulfatase A-like enzyme